MAVTARRMVREIPRAAILHIDTAEITKLVVVAYARVSTEKEEQEDSFERQVSHYTTLINSKPNGASVASTQTPASLAPARKNDPTSCG